MMTLNLRGLTSVSCYRLAVAMLAVGLAGCASMGERGGASIPAIGTWDIGSEVAQSGAFLMTLTLKADMSGTILVVKPIEVSDKAKSSQGMTAFRAITIPFSNAMVDGQPLMIVPDEVLRQEFISELQATVDGDTITGEYVNEIYGNIAFTGTLK